MTVIGAVFAANDDHHLHLARQFARGIFGVRWSGCKIVLNTLISLQRGAK